MDALSCPNCGVEFEMEGEEAEEAPEEITEEMATAEEEVPDEVPEEVSEETAEVTSEIVTEYPEEGIVEEVVTEEELEEALEDELYEEKPAKLFWIGLILMVGGFFSGPIASYLHDVLKIPVGNYKAYYDFGWVNWIVAGVGSIIMLIGVVLLIIGWLKISRWRKSLEEPLEEMESFEDEEMMTDEIEEVV